MTPQPSKPATAPMTPTELAELIISLRVAGERTVELDRERDAVMAERDKLILRAFEAGVATRVIADTAIVSHGRVSQVAANRQRSQARAVTAAWMDVIHSDGFNERVRERMADSLQRRSAFGRLPNRPPELPVDPPRP